MIAFQVRSVSECDLLEPVNDSPVHSNASRTYAVNADHCHLYHRGVESVVTEA